MLSWWESPDLAAVGEERCMIYRRMRCWHISDTSNSSTIQCRIVMVTCFSDCHLPSCLVYFHCGLGDSCFVYCCVYLEYWTMYFYRHQQLSLLGKEAIKVNGCSHLGTLWAGQFSLTFPVLWECVVKICFHSENPFFFFSWVIQPFFPQLSSLKMNSMVFDSSKITFLSVCTAWCTVSMDMFVLPGNIITRRYIM